MFSPPRLTGSCFAPKAIGVALVASSLASCGPDITRFDNRSYRAASYSLHPNSESSSTRTASGLDPFFVIRPKADVPIAGPGHTAGLPSPKNALAHLSNRQQKVASKEGHVLSRKKEKPRVRPATPCPWSCADQPIMCGGGRRTGTSKNQRSERASRWFA